MRSPANYVTGQIASMAVKRAPRFKRMPEAAGGLRIQDRDIEIIRLVYEYRFLDSGRIQALIAGSDQVILRRLQKLFHHGYLDRPVSQIVFSNPLLGHENMVYGLGDKGADLLSEKLGIDRGNIIWKEKNKEVGERYIQHTLMISNFRTCLALALNDTPGARLLFWIRENTGKLREKDYVHFREDGKERRLPIVPDGVLGIEESRDEIYFCLEADRSTMTNARFLNKLRAYWLWYGQGGQRKKFGFENFRVLTLTRTKRRMENLIQATQRLDDKDKNSYMFWFCCEKDYDLSNSQTVLQKIWRTAAAGDHKLHSLLE